MSRYTQLEFMDAIDAWTKRMFGTQKSAAKHLHVSEQYLSDFLNGKRQPGAKLLRALHAEKVVTYKWG